MYSRNSNKISKEKCIHKISIKSNDMILIMYPRLKITSKIENHISFEILGLIHYYVMHGNSLSIDNDSKPSMTEWTHTEFLSDVACQIKTAGVIFSWNIIISLDKQLALCIYCTKCITNQNLHPLLTNCIKLKHDFFLFQDYFFLYSLAVKFMYKCGLFFRI